MFTKSYIMINYGCFFLLYIYYNCKQNISIFATTFLLGHFAAAAAKKAWKRADWHIVMNVENYPIAPYYDVVVVAAAVVVLVVLVLDGVV